jgi:hypothetical protein
MLMQGSRSHGLFHKSVSASRQISFPKVIDFAAADPHCVLENGEPPTVGERDKKRRAAIFVQPSTHPEGYRITLLVSQVRSKSPVFYSKERFVPRFHHRTFKSI